MNRDFEEFFALLNAKQVEYLLIGGVAYNFYAPPRATKDIDIWVNPERTNLLRLRDAISEFGFPVDALDLDDLAVTERVLMLGQVPNRIDVLTRPAGLVWSGASDRKVAAQYGATPINILHIDDLLVSKRAAGRPRDLADVASLERIKARREG